MYAPPHPHPHTHIPKHAHTHTHTHTHTHNYNYSYNNKTTITTTTTQQREPGATLASTLLLYLGVWKLGNKLGVAGTMVVVPVCSKDG